MKRARRGGGSRRPTRKFVWARQEGIITNVAVDGVTRTALLSDFETLYGAQLIGCTIVRIRGLIGVRPVTAASSFNSVRAAVQVEPNPSGAPVVADGPYGGEHNDWMLFEPFHTASGVGNSEVDGRVIDVRSSRKLEELNQGLFLYFGTRSTNTSAVDVVFDLSIGIKLP